MTLIWWFAFVFTFALTEGASYLMHRFLFHGPLWGLHKTHHLPRAGRWELNDLFSGFFTLIAIGLLILGTSDPWHSPWFGAGAGLTFYGLLYFVVHDAFTHRRLLAFQSSNPLLNALRRAHRRHHQSIEKPGQEPFGLFWFHYRK